MHGLGIAGADADRAAHAARGIDPRLGGEAFTIAAWHHLHRVEGAVFHALGAGVTTRGLDDGLIIGGRTHGDRGGVFAGARREVATEQPGQAGGECERAAEGEPESAILKAQRERERGEIPGVHREVGRLLGHGGGGVERRGHEPGGEGEREHEGHDQATVGQKFHPVQTHEMHHQPERDHQRQDHVEKEHHEEQQAGHEAVGEEEAAERFAENGQCVEEAHRGGRDLLRGLIPDQPEAGAADEPDHADQRHPRDPGEPARAGELARESHAARVHEQEKHHQI